MCVVFVANSTHKKSQHRDTLLRNVEHSATYAVNTSLSPLRTPGLRQTRRGACAPRKSRACDGLEAMWDSFLLEVIH